jgi:hypothetical protein
VYAWALVSASVWRWKFSAFAIIFLISTGMPAFSTGR